MLKETSLVDHHKKQGAKLVDFSGWNMPLNYGSQIEEHNAVRNDAGMFDVSHMTVVDIKGGDAKVFLQKLLANDVDKLKIVGKALYTGMLNEQGGVIDDLIVYLMEDGYRMVVNCATREKDLAWMQQQAQAFSVQVEERPEMAIIAIQGPNARRKVDAILNIDALAELKPFQGKELSAFGRNEWLVARTGYTGEDGYEIILPQTHAPDFWQSLADAGVKPCGLGARDTLRLEAGMNLYGHEMDDGISPLVANMAWTIAWEPEGRAFVGREVLEQQRQQGVSEKLVGLVLKDKGVLREGYEVIVEGSDIRGVITSGSFSPTLGHSIAIARVPVAIGETCEVKVRNKVLSCDVVAPNFVRNGKKVF